MGLFFFFLACGFFANPINLHLLLTEIFKLLVITVVVVASSLLESVPTFNKTLKIFKYPGMNSSIV